MLSQRCILSAVTKIMSEPEQMEREVTGDDLGPRSSSSSSGGTSTSGSDRDVEPVRKKPRYTCTFHPESSNTYDWARVSRKALHMRSVVFASGTYLLHMGDRKT